MQAEKSLKKKIGKCFQCEAVWLKPENSFEKAWACF